MNTTPQKKQGDAEAADLYPGVEINDADRDKNTPCLRKERTSVINNNPRNHEFNKDA